MNFERSQFLWNKNNAVISNFEQVFASYLKV